MEPDILQAVIDPGISIRPRALEQLAAAERGYRQQPGQGALVSLGVIHTAMRVLAEIEGGERESIH